MGSTKMMRLIVSLTLYAAAVMAIPEPIAPVQPHLAQAWTALSTGDGLPGKVGKESYLFEDCHHKGGESDDCKQAHIFDYGADVCQKFEIDAGYKSSATGSCYVKCDAVDCCYDDNNDPPDVKSWDIPQSSWWKSTKVSYLGKHDTTALNETVKNADVWQSLSAIPFTKVGVNYTYYITKDGNDTISHRINFMVPGTSVKAGSIEYKDFKVQHDIDTFRKTFVPPAVCLQKSTMSCSEAHIKRVEQKYFKHSAARKGWY